MQVIDNWYRSNTFTAQTFLLQGQAFQAKQKCVILKGSLVCSFEEAEERNVSFQFIFAKVEQL